MIVGQNSTVKDALNVRAEKIIFLKGKTVETEKVKEAQQVIMCIDYLIKNGVIRS